MTLPTHAPEVGRLQGRLPSGGCPRVLVCACLAWVALGCGGATAARPPGHAERRDTRVLHEPCDLESGAAERLDANGDGRPDITIVRAEGRELCRAVDLNFDARIDVFAYRAADGTLRRRESDYDRDGQIDEIAYYRRGQISEKHQVTRPARRLDTWRYYQGGRLVRALRDSNGDASIDQWWEFRRPGCPLIHADLDHDGRPDPGATVDYCKSFPEAAEVPDAAASQAEPGAAKARAPGSAPSREQR